MSWICFMFETNGSQVNDASTEVIKSVGRLQNCIHLFTNIFKESYIAIFWLYILASFLKVCISSGATESN